MCDSVKFQSCVRFVFLLLLISLMPLALSCGSQVSGSPTKDFKIATEYQAVFLDNGQVFFGKLENTASAYPILKEVYYVQTRQEPETQQVKSILIKRGNEWHSPDVMYINSSHIVVIESVSPTSKVAQLIKEAKDQKPVEKP